MFTDKFVAVSDLGDMDRLLVGLRPEYEKESQTRSIDGENIPGETPSIRIVPQMLNDDDTWFTNEPVELTLTRNEARELAARLLDAALAAETLPRINK